MTSDNEDNDGSKDLQPISEDVQDISTDEIVEADYNVVPESASDQASEESSSPSGHPSQGMPAPGRFLGLGSVDASSDDVGFVEGDSFTAGYESEAATHIGDGSESDGFDRLRELNDGRHRTTGDLSTKESQRDKQRIAQAICSSLPVTDDERQRVSNIVRNLDLDLFGSQKQIESVVLGTVAVVVDEARAENGGDPGEVSLVSRSDEFRDYCDEFAVSMSDLSTIKQKVREQLDEQPSRRSVLSDPDPSLPDIPPSEYPDEYWDRVHEDTWEGISEGELSRSDEWLEAVPDRYAHHLPDEFGGVNSNE
jgi:hypothetical protein